jgi:hypothetical protein
LSRETATAPWAAGAINTSAAAAAAVASLENLLIGVICYLFPLPLQMT